MATKSKPYFSSLALALIAIALLVAGWLMKPVPLLIFAGLAPLFALTDRVRKNDFLWESSEWVLLVLVFSFGAAHIFRSTSWATIVIQAIVFTIPFIAFNFLRHVLNDRLGKFPIIIFWLGLEYFLLKTGWLPAAVYLAETFEGRLDWVAWNVHTGYLGGSAWILLTNMILYRAFFGSKKINFYLILIFVLLVVMPVVLSYAVALNPVSAAIMKSFYYQHQEEMASPLYLKHGEVVGRTAAWIAVLVLLFALVKSKTNKR